jgi:hypothetical protein
MTPQEVKQRAYRGEKDGRVSYWLRYQQYRHGKFKEAWQGFEHPVENAESIEPT